MSTYKHKTKRAWRYDFELAKQRYTSRWYDSLREATDAEAAHRTRILTGLSGAWPTFSALAAEWQEHRASRGVSKHTMAQSFNQFSKWLSPIANRPPIDITPLELQRLFDRVAAETSPANANALRRQVGACFGFAARLGNLARNPAKLTRPYVEPQRVAAEIDAISTAHLRAVLVAAPPWLARLLTVQALTGARWVEIARLRPEDCHLDAVPPFAMLTHYKGGERSRRRILPAAAVTALAEQMRDAGGYVWPGKPATKHVGYSWCLTHLQRACDRAGVPRYSFHAVRRWAATTATLAGVSSRVVADFLGHADEHTVARYQQIEDAVVDAISATLARELA